VAEIVLGIGTSHSPLLSFSATSWEPWGRRDSQIPAFHDDGGTVLTYDDLLARPHPGLAERLDLAVYEDNVVRCRAAIDQLGATLRDARLDALVVVGDDQAEHLHSDNLPPILVYHGATLRNTVADPPPDAPAEIVELIRGYHEPDVDVDYPVHVELAHHVISHLFDAGFDVATSDRLPRERAEGHAIQFPHRRIVGPELPIVPILLNTYNPPSQPRVGRCFQLGSAVAEALRAYDGLGRVGLLASGGLSHFVVLEEFDRRVLQALADKDHDWLCAIPEAVLQSGTSEIKNWVTVAAACAHLDFAPIDYVPGYRTPAGTGTGLAFGVWS